MPTKDEPILSIRLSDDLDRRLQAVAALLEVKKSAAGRHTMDLGIQQVLAVEQAPDEPHVGQRAPGAAVDGRSPAPAESSGPSWVGERPRFSEAKRGVVPRPKKSSS